MVNELTPQIDILSSSKEQLMAVAFSKSNSPNYPLVVNIAKGAFRYHEETIGNRPYHVAIFSKTPTEARKATIFLNYTEGWKSLQIFVNGRIIRNPWDLLRVLECYLAAVSCNDYKAHCHSIIDDPYKQITDMKNFVLHIFEEKKNTSKMETIDQYIFPCNYLLPRFRFTHTNQASTEDVIQAASVEYLCDICPYFDYKAFHTLGTRIIKKEY